MTREAVEQELDRHLSNIGALNRERAIAFGLSISAAAREEAEEEIARLRAAHDELLDCYSTTNKSAMGWMERAEKAERSRQALVEALRKAQPEADLLAISHRKTTGLRGTKCQACSHVWPCPTIRLLDSRAAALATHGQDR